MADLLLEQEPITATQDTPTIVGVNDGTLWNSSATLTFVGLQQGEGVPPDSDPGRQDEAQAQLSPGQAFTASALWVYVSANWDSDHIVPDQLVLEWEMEGTGWKVAYDWLMPTPENNRHNMTWTLGDVDANATITGTLTLSDFAADVAAGNVYIRGRTGVVPGYGRVTLHDFQVWVTEGGRTFVHQFPSDHTSAWGGAAQIYPPSKTNQIIGGIQ